MTEASRFTFEHVAQRLERPTVWSSDGPAPATVIEHGIHCLLQHPFLIADDNIRGTELHESLEAVVSIDHSSVEIIEV